MTEEQKAILWKITDYLREAKKAIDDMEGRHPSHIKMYGRIIDDLHDAFVIEAAKTTKP